MIRVIALVFIFLLPIYSNAALIQQAFNSSWYIEPYDYYGQNFAAEWSYYPYDIWDTSLGKLQEVRINTEISGEKSSSEDLRVRLSFFSGWNPADYQFAETLNFNSGSTQFSDTFEWVFSGTDLDNWLTYDYSQQANYYFESRTWNNPHSIEASTILTYIYTPVPEPNIILALFIFLMYMLYSCRTKRLGV